MHVYPHLFQVLLTTHPFNDDNDRLSPNPPQDSSISILMGGHACDDGSADDDGVCDVARSPVTINPPRKLSRRSLKPVLNYRSTKPAIALERICTYDLPEEKAPLRQVYIFFGRLFPHSPNVLTTSTNLTRLTIPDTELIDGFLRAPFGSYYINGLGSRNHYENSQATVDKFIAEAHHRGIKVCNHSGTTGPIKLDEGRYQFLLLNGIDHKGMIEGMCFEEIGNDLLIPDTGFVPKLTKRRNRAVTIGLQYVTFNQKKKELMIELMSQFRIKSSCLNS